MEHPSIHPCRFYTLSHCGTFKRFYVEPNNSEFKKENPFTNTEPLNTVRNTIYWGKKKRFKSFFFKLSRDLNPLLHQALLIRVLQSLRLKKATLFNISPSWAQGFSKWATFNNPKNLSLFKEPCFYLHLLWVLPISSIAWTHHGGAMRAKAKTRLPPKNRLTRASYPTSAHTLQHGEHSFA